MMIHFFRNPVNELALPGRFTNPFDYTPHPLCVQAAAEVQKYLGNMDFWQRCPGEGKMFGVLVVQTPEGKTGFLAAFSGILDGSYLHPYFVPPVYNLQQPEGFFHREEEEISALHTHICRLEEAPAYQEAREQLEALRRQAAECLAAAKEALRTARRFREQLRSRQPGAEEIARLIRESQHQKAEYKRLARYWKDTIDACQVRVEEYATRIASLKSERKQRSAALQQWLFCQFRFLNARGEIRDLCDIFRDTAGKVPPAGAGDCAAPKLLQYAYLHGLRPVAMAEFWWGSSPATEIRRQGDYYPACRGKCLPILKHMLKGLKVEESFDADEREKIPDFPEVIYEDSWLVVVDKPAGMLSVPGKTSRVSLYELARRRYPEATGPLLVHRLDMATSGLLVIAKTKEVHKQLQCQFLQHTVSKGYIALLDGRLDSEEGEICLPLCPDPYDRPRQMVSEVYGKPALTYYRVLERTDQQSRVAFRPQTGRTHQLRVHAAHPLGLNCPVSGDTLYGKKAARLYLHAGFLEFIHPCTGLKVRLERKTPF